LIQRRLERVTSIGRKIGLNDEKGYAVAILIVLIIVSALVAGYYLVFNTPPAGYNTIYILDAQKQAVNYPVSLVANQNSTFDLWIGVVNNMGGNGNQSYQVLVKITSNPPSFPVNVQPTQTYDLSLRNTATWQTESTITLNQVGNYWVVFELWHQNSAGTYDFTNDEADLNVQVTS
jgi:uncharacterized membrane protein